MMEINRHMMSYDRVESLRVREQKVKEGLELIIRHLDDSMSVWALGRWISTYVKTNSGKEQRFRLVYSEQEALAWYKAANFLDSRIRAYHSTHSTDSTDDTNIAPPLLLVDIDREHFNTTEEFEQCAAKTRANFKEILDARPTQMWTGNGYHFLQPQFVLLLEKVETFKKFKQPSLRFMRFEEQLLTDGKADQNHINNVSFGNCMLRVPGSLNSNQVRFNNGEIVDIPPKQKLGLPIIGTAINHQ